MELIRQLVVPGRLTPLYGLLMQHVDGIDRQGHFPSVVRLDPLFRDLALYLGRRFGPRCHWPPMARCVKPGDRDAQWAMHRDVQYNPHIAGKVMTVWLPLTPIDDECGGIATPNAIMAPMMAGDALIFDEQELHRSMPNRSQRIRLSCDFRFFAGASGKHYLDTVTGELVLPC